MKNIIKSILIFPKVGLMVKPIIQNPLKEKFKSALYPTFYITA